MTDREYKTTRRRIIKIWNDWRSRLGFRHWTMTVDFVRDRDVTAEGWECLGRAATVWEYMKATITFYVPGLVSKSDKDLEEIVVHEMCHILVAEMRQFANERIDEEKGKEAMKHEERVVTMLTNAFLWTKGDFKGKK